ncbi:MAG: TRAP transporter fused permease subunit [Clostridiaceae bacterium]
MGNNDIPAVTGRGTKSITLIITVLSIAVSLFHVFISYSTAISVMQQRVFHLFILVLIFYLYKFKDSLENHKKSSIIPGILGTATLITGIYFMVNTSVTSMLQRGITGSTTADIIIGVILILLILDITWRTVGFALTVIAVVFLAFALLGPYMPDIIAHKGYDIPYITNYISWTMEGIFGTPIGASVSFVALYIIFGELLDQFGAGKFFIEVAYALTGRMKGGPAESAVVSSALMGSINGSAVANVVTTGTFTIPLMKKVGYKPHFAGAVEAVASTGGQLLPPVMGAAAFVMADMTGIPYSKIIIAAIIPGILYYLSLGVSVYLEADKLGLEAEPRERLPQLKKVLKNGWYYSIPIIMLIVALLGLKLSANYSALFAIAVLLVVGCIKTILSEKRFPIKEIIASLVSSAKTTISVAMACACAGIVIGIVSMTGIGVRFTSIVFDISGGNVLLMLMMIMLACIVLGMGLPATAAYVIAATIGVPPLISAGIPAIAANMFVFYFAIISFITPPVAIAAYAAAGIADSNAMKTGWQAFILGLSGFIIPFVYAYNPALLIIDTSTGATVYITILTTFAVVLMAVAISGWLRGKLSILARLVFLASAILMFIQGNKIFDIAGIILGVAALAATLAVRSRKKIAV